MNALQLFGIIGYPLGHSKSPVLHNWAFAQLHYGAAFVPWAIEPTKLTQFIESMHLLHIAGACVTIPHKEKVVPLLDGMSEQARSVGAVNTLYWNEDRLYGENTDVYGFMLPLQQHTLDTKAHCLVLGAGGAAKAVVVGLKMLGFEHIYISSHSNNRAIDMANTFGLHCIAWEERAKLEAQYIINTTPLGMLGDNVHLSPYPEEAFMRAKAQVCLAYDLVYNPLETKFLRMAKAAGWQTQDGLDMFVGQALRQMHIWTGRSTDFQATRTFLQGLM